MTNLAVVLEDSARQEPDREAVVFGELRLSYALVDALANQVANLLVSRGVRRGDKVALACPNLPYFPFVYFGALKIGATVVPLNVLLTAREIAYHLDDSDAVALFCFEGTPELPLGQRGWEGFQQAERCEHFIALPASAGARESAIEGAESLWAALDGQSPVFATVETEPQDTAVILYTSGTTGRPKGAELSHLNMLMNAMVSDTMFERKTDGGQDVYLAVLPLFHSFGQTVVLNAGFLRRGRLVLLPRFDASAALDLMEREGVTLFAGVPTMFWGLLNAAEGRDAAAAAKELATAVSGGSPMPLEVLRAFEAAFGVTVLEGYGLSETSPVASFNQYTRPTKPGTIGFPIWGVQMKLVGPDGEEVTEGPGEIAVRGHNVMKGYYKRPEATAEVLRDGWLRTGDIATRDADGYYTIVDRAKDLIIRGGFNVYPREVEEVLMTHPGVSLAAVVGVPHEQHGEEVKAFVIRTADSGLTEEELIAWARENMAAFKYPRTVEFRDALPMTATGKILKRELR
ncbi:long-chain-fatty-acid--CoA ligase [Allonocardiopsis opalescens]|uniref:Long-chain acyl-CoA synthetase n=1 Tax=Allonocardiopsis opalescens TaxID=1144618 RepID=A0A2T0Q0Q5_9ACTN|nr:long-chain fatty acid--CoA ligase [Allonocardiopsis opalescens]PRX97377.1 long-chain acyl-CoA synthetase [Allonocardiopsis opalescens]